MLRIPVRVLFTWTTSPPTVNCAATSYRCGVSAVHVSAEGTGIRLPTTSETTGRSATGSQAVAPGALRNNCSDASSRGSTSTRTASSPSVYGADRAGVTARSRMATAGSLCSQTGRKIPLSTHMSWFSR